MGQELSTSSPRTSEKVNVGQKQLQYQGMEEDVGEEEEELGKENCNMNSSGDSGTIIHLSQVPGRR